MSCMLVTHADCNKQDDATHCVSHYYLPFMADDGYGGDITIPSVMISDYHGAQLRMGIKVYVTPNINFLILLQFIVWEKPYSFPLRLRLPVHTFLFSYTVR